MCEEFWKLKVYESQESKGLINLIEKNWTYAPPSPCTKHQEHSNLVGAFHHTALFNIPFLWSRSILRIHGKIGKDLLKKLGLNWAKLSSNWNWDLLWLRFAALYWWLQTTITLSTISLWTWLLSINCILACLIASFHASLLTYLPISLPT